MLMFCDPLKATVKPRILSGVCSHPTSCLHQREAKSRCLHWKPMLLRHEFSQSSKLFRVLNPIKYDPRPPPPLNHTTLNSVDSLDCRWPCSVWSPSTLSWCPHQWDSLPPLSWPCLNTLHFQCSGLGSSSLGAKNSKPLKGFLCTCWGCPGMAAHSCRSFHTDLALYPAVRRLTDPSNWQVNNKLTCFRSLCTGFSVLSFYSLSLWGPNLPAVRFTGFVHGDPFRGITDFSGYCNSKLGTSAGTSTCSHVCTLCCHVSHTSIFEVIHSFVDLCFPATQWMCLR